MESITEHDGSRPVTLIATFVGLSLLYYLGHVIYMLRLHPLAKIPGPRLNAISRLPYVRHLIKGTTAENVKKLHDKYGDVVRVTPNEISFISGETAWPQIAGFRTGDLKGHKNMQKDPVWYTPGPKGVSSILVANDEAHSRGRRVLSHAFSEKALAEQEPLLQHYVDLLISQIGKLASTSEKPLNMTEIYNWATFDIIAALLFGEPFGCLADLKTHDYVRLLFSTIEVGYLHYVLSYFPWMKYIGSVFVDKAMLAKRVEYHAWIRSQTQKRIASKTDKPDFMTHVLKHNGDKGLSMSEDEMVSNASLFIIAGSETTATLLAGVTYCLLKNPTVHQKLKYEVRSRWNTYDEITIEQVNNAPYLIAVLSEALRFFPPVPTGFPRVVPPGGEVVSGHYISGGASVYMSSWAAGHAERNFKDADSFVPERYMGDERYANDLRHAHQPFSFGPRNCLGKNLAYAEMRLILAKIIWSFDLELDASSENWLDDCKVYSLWRKPALNVRVKQVQRA